MDIRAERAANTRRQDACTTTGTQPRREIASFTFATKSSSTPLGALTWDLWAEGRMIRLKPRRAASMILCSIWGTGLTSPPRPTSPTTAVADCRGLLYCEPAMAIKRAGSAAGSATRMPPTADVKMSRSAKRTPLGYRGGNIRKTQTCSRAKAVKDATSIRTHRNFGTMSRKSPNMPHAQTEFAEKQRGKSRCLASSAAMSLMSVTAQHPMLKASTKSR